jgi:deazaflavin-dependent oxidoreductase (nitroreductase family)
MSRTLDLADKIWPLTRRVMGGHTFLYKATGGLVGHRVPFAPPTLLLDHVGAKSGTKRTSPLTYFRDGEAYVIVASKGGYPKNPAWFWNLKAHPDTTVQVGHRKIPVRARVADDEERERLWPRAVQTWSGYADYQRRSKGRVIPLVILEPR